MTDQTLDVSQSLDTVRKLIKITDNGDSTFAIAVSSSDLQSMNVLSTTVYDSILVTYTDATKATISKVEWKLGAAVVRTLTLVGATLTDTWTKT